MRHKTPNLLLPVLSVLILAAVASLGAAMYNTLKVTPGNTFASDDQVNYLQPPLVSQNMVTYYPEDTLAQPIFKETAPVFGSETAQLTLYYFGSFGCPYNADLQDTLSQVMQEYAGRVKLVWKDLPLSHTYPQADYAHLAARCAQEQDQFWQYAKLLWQNQDDFSQENLITLAQKLDLNTQTFETCLKTQATKDLIVQDILEADQLQIVGSPHFYLNDQEIFGSVDYQDLSWLIAIELNEED